MFMKSHADTVFFFFSSRGGLSLGTALSGSYKAAGIAASLCFKEVNFEKILKGRMVSAACFFLRAIKKLQNGVVALAAI